MPRARLGQHWLDDHRVCVKIADTIDPSPDETVVEIGGGKGALTKRIASRCRRLIVYEVDRNWADHLKAYAPGWSERKSEVEIREADILTVEWTRGALGLRADEPVVIAGNLPYYITSPLLLRLAYSGLDFNRAVFLIQKEVAEKIASGPGDSEYGRLTVSLGAFLETKTLFDVSPEAFKPPPKVNSTVIRMEPRSEPVVQKDEAGDFERTVQAAFHMRRKTLRNNLRAAFPEVSVERLNEILSCLNLNPNVRPQEVGVREYAALTSILKKEV
jgi:16S rRNA (adenine1518-N6/adenine1519-N6)-dimethyltransferase